MSGAQANGGSGRYQQDPMLFVALAAVAGGVFLSAPALVLGILLAPVARRAWMAFAVLALIGTAFVALKWGTIDTEMRHGGRAAHRAGGLLHGREALGAAWPHVRTWWLLAAPLCFTIADGITLFRRRTVEELRERQERASDRQRGRVERKARRAVGIHEPRSRTETAFELGRHVSGDCLLPTDRARVRMPLSRIGRIVLVIGAPGSGKTETLKRLAYGVATSSDAAVIVIDAKGDPETQAAFFAAMRQAGRSPRLFPQEPYDGWRGSGREITSRLVELIDWATEGGGTYYRDLSVNLVRRACTAPSGPPRSSAELLRRLDKTHLLSLWAGRPEADEIARFKDEHIDACRQRYRSFFDATAGQLDGEWALEDVDSAYLLLNELAYGEETSKVARLLIEDFKQFVATRKDAGQRVLLIIDEFSAIADGERMARTVEVVRSYGVGVVLAPQAFDGMGGPEASARILNAAHTIFLHAIPDPEPVVKAAGTRMATEFSVQHDHGQSTDVGSTRQQHQHRADPNEVRRLPPGMCLVIGSGQAQKVQIAPVRLGAPAPLAELPAPAEAADPEPSGGDDEPVRP